MDDVAELIQTTEVPFMAYVGSPNNLQGSWWKSNTSPENSSFISNVTYKNGKMTKQLFTHQDHVIDSGEMEVIGSSEHCEIAVCKHPTRPLDQSSFIQKLSSTGIFC